MDIQVKDQVALVGAASKGLGKSAAMALAREGARIAICARSEALDTTAEEIRSETGAEVLAVRTDLTKRDQVDAFVKQALDQYGQIDILIVNCGGPPPGSFMDLTVEDWEAGVQTTIMSALYLSYAVIPHMLERGSGSIVSTVSYSVKQPLARLITSNSLRLAVIGLMTISIEEDDPHFDGAPARKYHVAAIRQVIDLLIKYAYPGYTLSYNDLPAIPRQKPGPEKPSN